MDDSFPDAAPSRLGIAWTDDSLPNEPWRQPMVPTDNSSTANGPWDSVVECSVEPAGTCTWWRNIVGTDSAKEWFGNLATTSAASVPKQAASKQSDTTEKADIEHTSGDRQSHLQIASFD